MIWQQLSEGERQAAVHTTAVGKNIQIRGTGTSIHAFMCLKNVCK